MMRILVRILLSLIVVIAVAAAVLAVHTWRTWDRVWDAPLPDLHASSDPAVIARGEYLVTGPAHCVECHVPSIADYERVFSSGAAPVMSGGYRFPVGPLGVLYSRNITPDVETGIGRYTDPQIARLLRHGVPPDGRSTITAFMPFGGMSDDDVVAVISYLRSQPPVRHVVSENEWTLFGKVMKSLVPAAKPKLDVHPPRTAPPSEVSRARGEYLARAVADCGGCHTPFSEMTAAPIGPEYSGGIPMEPIAMADADLSRWLVPPNITPLEGSALRRFPDRATFVARFKVGGRKHLGSPMPWEAFSRMTPEDIGAVYEYLMGQAPAGEPAPEDPTVPR